MISMNNFATQAVEKLAAEKKNVSGNKEKAMAGAVFAAIKDFCIQEEKFAQAVVQGGTFADCMKKVAEGVGSSISDLDAYKKAVQFYFPGAEIRMQMSIDLVGNRNASKLPKIEEKETVVSEPKSSMILDLADFFC